MLADYGRVTAAPDPRVAAELAAAAGGRRRRHPLRRADRAVQGAARAGQGAVGLPPPLRRRRPGCTCVGGTSSFEYTKALQDFVDDLGLSAAVRLPGEVSDAALAAYFAAADVYLSLSAHEGFGVPLVEAMVAGVPVVTRGAGAVADTVADAALRAGRRRPLLRRGRPAPGLHRRAAPRHADRRGRAPGGRALRATRWPPRIVEAVARGGGRP